MTVLRAVRHAWLLVLFAAVAGGVGGAAALHQQTPEYRSSVQLLVAVQGATTADDDTRNRSSAIARAFGLAQIASTTPALADAQRIAGTRSTAAVAVGAADLSDPFVRVEVTDPDRRVARAVAGAFVRSLPGTAADLGIATGSDVSLVVLSPASATVVAAPIGWRYLLAGIAAGLGAGLALALGREILATAPTSAEDTAALGGWPLLAVVPEGARRGPVVAAARSPQAEAYRQVLTAAVHAAPRGVRTLAVAGVGPHGATGLTANLLALATAGGHDAVALDPATSAPRLLDLRAHGGHDLLVVDAGRVLPRPTRPELLAAADVVVLAVTWPQRGRVRAAGRTLARLEVRVAGLVVLHGPVDPQTRQRACGEPTTTVPVGRVAAPAFGDSAARDVGSTSM